MKAKTNNHWLKSHLRGVDSNRDGYGTRVWVKTGDKTQVRELVSGAGYFTQMLGNSTLALVIPKMLI